MNPVVRVTRSRCKHLESIDSDNSERSNTPSVFDLDSNKSETPPPLLAKQVNSPEENLRHLIDTPTKRITRRAQSEIKLLDTINSPLRRRTRRAGSVSLDENSKDVISHDEETKSPPPSASNQQQQQLQKTSVPVRRITRRSSILLNESCELTPVLVSSENSKDVISHDEETKSPPPSASNQQQQQLQQTPVPARRITRRSSILLNESCELTPVLVSSPSRRSRRRNSINLTEEQDEKITMKIQKNTLLDTCVPEEDAEKDNFSTTEKQDQNNYKTNDNANTLSIALCTRSRSKSPNVINLDTINEENETPQKDNFNMEAKEALQNNDEKELIINESKTEKDNNKINHNHDESIKIISEENKNEEKETTRKSENDLVILKIVETSDNEIENENINESNLNKSNDKFKKGKLNKSLNEKTQTDEFILDNTSKINKLNLGEGNNLHQFNKISEFNNNSKLNDSIQPMEVDETMSEVEVFFSKKEDKESNELPGVEINMLSKSNNQNLEKSSNNFNETTKLSDSKHSETENNNSVIENEKNDDEIAQNDKSDKENIEMNNKITTSTTVAQAILKSKYNDDVENVITPFKKKMSSELTASSTPIATNISIDEKQNYSITKDVSHNQEEENKKLETLSKYPKTPLPSKTRSLIVNDKSSSSSSTKESENKLLNETHLSVSSSNKKLSKIRGVLNLSESSSSSLSLLNNSKNNNEKDENNSKSRCSDFAKSWSQSVKGTADTTIDSFGLKKYISNNDCNDRDTSNKTDTEKSFKKKYIEEAEEQDQAEEEEKSKEKNEFIDDEAEEVSDSDSLDSEERKYLKQNEIPERGESLGSQDTDNDRSDDDNEVIDEEIASFIVSDEEETENEVDMDEEAEEEEEEKMSVDEDDDNDESKSGNMNNKKEIEKKRRSMQIISSSEDEEVEDVKGETKQKSITESQNEEEKEKALVVTEILENKLDNETENNDKNEESPVLKNDDDDEPAAQKSSKELNTTNNDDLGETVEGELLMSAMVLETTTDHKSSLDENLINNDQINSNKKSKISLDKSIKTSTVISEVSVQQEIVSIKKLRHSLPARRMSLYLPENYRETKSEEKEIKISSDNKKVSKKLNDKHDEEQKENVKNKDSESFQNENDKHQSLPISSNDNAKIIKKSSNANFEDSSRNSSDISFFNLKYIFEKRSADDNVNSDENESDGVDNADDKDQDDNIDKNDENNYKVENSCSDDNDDDNSDSDVNVDDNVNSDESESDGVDNADDKDQDDNVDENDENNYNVENSCSDDNADYDSDEDDDKADNNYGRDKNDNNDENESDNSSDEEIGENKTEIHHKLQDSFKVSKDNKINTLQEESGDNDDFITRIMKRCNEVLKETKNEVKIPNQNKSKINKKKKLKQQKKEVKERDQKETTKSLEPEKQVEKALKFSEKLLQKKIKNSKPMKFKSCDEENIKTTSPEKIVTKKSQLNKEKDTNKKSIKISPLKKSIQDDVMIKQRKRKISDVCIDEPKDIVKKKKRNITAIIKNPSGLIYEEPLTPSSNNKIKVSEFSWGVVKEEPFSNETLSSGFKETPVTPKPHKFKIDELYKKSENIKIGKNKNKTETMKDYPWGSVHEEPLQIKPKNISKSIGHKLNKAMSAGQIEPPTLNKNKNKNKIKKIISEPITVPPKPSWIKNSKELQPSSSLGSLIRIPTSSGSTNDDAGTEFFLQPLTGKKRKRQAIDTVSETALQFKKKTLSNDKVPRETSKQLLQKKDKQRFNYY